ncbi:hypothetical protein ERX27_10720 [Macrococcus brunensis]|uniref:Uncharacterized protein n=1 Tax=Macrococcus brunensis TaxID=198483 RepID=A0A4V3BD24_9STAP|nr:hypothetical protein [Macrococcus brunensis]TDL93359.1 hypothetical protein ERX27_10720 [Macrococcus brunensis]
MTNEVNWKEAYLKLEEQIEFMMKNTQELLENNPPKLEINKLIIDRNNGYTSVIADATGSDMTYACYLYDKKNNKELLRLKYQYANSFVFKLPKGEYIAKVFVRENLSETRKVVESIRFYS